MVRIMNSVHCLMTIQTEKRRTVQHNDLYIVDNSSEPQSVKHYLTEWCQISKQMDIATGYLEIGGLLELDGHWQKLEKIRIILGKEMTRRSKEVIDTVVKDLLDRLHNSLNDEQEKNTFLVGVPAILQAFKTGKIECRVYDEAKFHAKAYITCLRDEVHAQFIQAMNVPLGYALVGSSNFTRAGLTQNIELNVQIGRDVDQLQNWFDKRWEEGKDITASVLTIIENHIREFSPYDVYFRSMYEYFQNSEESVSEWEQHDSVIYSLLSQYQKDGYNSLVGIANRWSGAFLCDGVGLGKTYVGMMLIERFVLKERSNVVLLVPAAARTSVWETTIKKYIPEILEGFPPFKIVNHSDLLLEKNENLMQQIQERAEIIIIDEAHHFRNRSSSRYRKLFNIMNSGRRKQIFMLTATPINNSFLDLQHLIELFTSGKDNYFAAPPLGIHSLSSHFKKMERELERLTDSSIADSMDVSENIFRSDELVNELVVQRSRAYVKRSLSTGGGSGILFSERQSPIVANYSLRTSYGRLIDDFIDSFYRTDKNTGRSLPPILALAVYSPYEEEYYIGDKTKIDAMVSGRQRQVVNLIRQLLLKRFESSIAAFEETCIRIYHRLHKFLNDYGEQGDSRLIERTLDQQKEVLDHVTKYIGTKNPLEDKDMEDELPDYVWNAEENLSVEDFDIHAMLVDTILDMNVLAQFIEDIMNLDFSKDDKIRELKRILSEEKHIKDKKVIIFTEYRTTAKHIHNELKKSGFDQLYEIDGQTRDNLHDIVVRFSPYYNDSCSSQVENEIKILIATDVLSEGLNLQDASCLINYDLHWNPVRLMQRIGRIDRRRDAEIENRLLTDHPELRDDRKNAYYWNFLPPEELENLLNLYKTVSKKALRISKTFGIEGKKLLTPEDDYEALKEFNSQYEGKTSREEEMVLAYRKMLTADPNYPIIVKSLPKKMYSGKKANCNGYFFCFELPMKTPDGSWSTTEDLCRWYLLDTDSHKVTGNIHDIWSLIKCTSGESRRVVRNINDFTAARKEIEAHITETYMRQVQAPMGVRPRLVTWMELSKI